MKKTFVALCLVSLFVATPFAIAAVGPHPSASNPNGMPNQMRQPPMIPPTYQTKKQIKNSSSQAIQQKVQVQNQSSVANDMQKSVSATRE